VKAKRIAKLAGLLIATCMTTCMSKASFVYTASGSDADESLHAEATLVFGGGTLTITLENLQSGEVSAGQGISGITLSGVTGIISLTSAQGSLVDFSKKGVMSTPSGVTSLLVSDGGHWGLDGSSGLWALTGGKPDDLIVGPNPNANNGFGSHNPYVYRSATFTIHDSEFTAKSAVSGVNILFGTAGTESLPAALQSNIQPIPEASTIFAGIALLLPLGVGALRVLRKKCTG
jgi:hypothetical protein